MASKQIAWIGIDPGKSGGIALVTNEGLATAKEYPGTITEAASIVAEFKKCWGLRGAVIERVHAMPKQGVSSTFKFGMNYGAWQGILAAFNIPYQTVTPRQWQKDALDAGSGETKERSLDMARRLFPGVDLSRKKDHGKADALHLARWGLRYGG